MNTNALIRPVLLIGLLLATLPAQAAEAGPAGSLPDYQPQVRKQLQQRLADRLQRDMTAEFRRLPVPEARHRLAEEEGRPPVALPRPQSLGGVHRAQRITVPARAVPVPGPRHATLI